MPVKTKCLFDPPEESDGRRLLVCHSLPKGKSEKDLQGEWQPEFGPSYGLLSDWKQGNITWEEYERRYKAGIRYLDAIVRWAREGTITLLCWEKESNPHCHRYILKGMIEEVLTGDDNAPHK